MGVLRSFQGVQGTIGQPTAQVIDGSLSFKPTAWNSGSQRLERTPGSSSNRRTWTWSAWVKRGARFSGTNETHLFDSRVNDDDRFYGIAFTGPQDGEFLFVWEEISSGNYHYHKALPSLRDNGWYHLVVAVDTTQSSGSDRVKFYANGELLALAAENGSYPWYAQNYDTNVNQASSTHTIGSYYDQRNFDGYICQNYLIDGQALGPETFGFTDPLTNTWRPKKAKITGPNAGQVWSSNVTLNSGNRSNGSGDAAMFDGILPAAYGSGGNFGGIKVTPSETSSSLTINFGQTFTGVSVTIYPYFAASAATCKVDFGGGDIVTLTGSELYFGAYELGTHTFSSMTLTQVFVTGGGSNFGIGGIAIDGVMLINSTTNNFGPNGFYLPMDNDDFHIDKSGKGNDYTKVNFSGTSINPDIVKDSPSGAVFGGRAQTGITTTSSAPANYCTLNPIDKESNVVLSNGNLDGTASGGDGNYRGTMRMISGKFYWEVTQVSGGNYSTYGIIRDGQLPISELNSDTITYRNDGLTKKNGVVGSTYNSISGDEVLGIACDCDKNEISYYKNNTLQGTLTFTTNMAVEGVYAYGRWNSGKSADYNFGQKPFKYAPPQGFLPVNSATTRPNTVISRPDQYVGITTWKGDGNTGRQIRTLSFSPDLVWIKQSSASRAHAWFDTVRGANKRLQSSTTNGETTHTDQMSAFLSNGFTVEDNNTVNVSDGIYRGFCWKAGGSKNTFNIDDVGYSSAAAAGLDGGSINPTGASIGTKQGFSIIGYTGTDNTSDTFAHGLSQKPDFALFKNRSQDGDDWISYNSTPSLGATKRVKFNTADGSDSQTSQFNDTEPTSSLFTIGTYDNINKLNNNYIAYIWHNVPGLQKFGEFLGDGGSGDDGPFVETGFRPALIWLRPFAGTGIANNGGWYIWDVQNDSNPYNDDSAVNKPGNYFNYGNLNNGMDSHAMAGIDILSNGFKLRTDTAGYSNFSGWTYIYCAFADTPASNLFGGQSNAR